MSSGFDSLVDRERSEREVVLAEFKERPKTKVLSRGTEIDREKVLENIGGEQAHLIHVAARMTRKILAERRKTEIDPYVTPVDALKVLESEKIDISEYLLVPPDDKWRQEYYLKKLNDGWQMM